METAIRFSAFTILCSLFVTLLNQQRGTAKITPLDKTLLVSKLERFFYSINPRNLVVFLPAALRNVRLNAS